MLIPPNISNTQMSYGIYFHTIDIISKRNNPIGPKVIIHLGIYSTKWLASCFNISYEFQSKISNDEDIIATKLRTFVISS